MLECWTVQHPVSPMPEWLIFWCRNQSSTRIRGPSPVPECSGVGLSCGMPECRCQQHQPQCRCPAIVKTVRVKQSPCFALKDYKRQYIIIIILGTWIQKMPVGACKVLFDASTQGTVKNVLRVYSMTQKSLLTFFSQTFVEKAVFIFTTK